MKIEQKWAQGVPKINRCVATIEFQTSLSIFPPFPKKSQLGELSGVLGLGGLGGVEVTIPAEWLGL